MTAEPGTKSFTTKQSAAAEKKHKLLVEQECCKYPRIEIKKGVPIEELTSGNNPYSLMKNGESQSWFADGGWIYVDGKLAGVAECKYQGKRPNACERACRYLTVFNTEPHRIFVSSYGPGFVKLNGGGATGPFIDMTRHCGMVVLENPTNEEFRSGLQSWIEGLLERREK
jgi:hypothetical protein